MNKKRIFIFLLSATFLFSTIITSFAHSNAYAGKLKDYYFRRDDYNGYFIGTEAIGWRADENKHAANRTITYKYGCIMPDEYINLINEGMALWEETGIVEFEYDENCNRYFNLVPSLENNNLAEFTDFESDDYGHLTAWNININTNATKSAKVIAHELGHAIGLIDLYDSSNNNKLMYAAPLQSSATGPTARDIMGASVITGQHTHTWTYSYYATTSTGNMHLATTCPSCGGEPKGAEKCIYNSNNICSKCGTPKGASPYVIEEPEEIE